MISSQNVVLFSYAVWLLGRVEYGVALDRLREVVARWFFMASITARYSGSFESQVEKDFQAIAELAAGDADGFVRALNRIVDDTLTADFWTITLPNELATSAARSPALFAYMAALNVLDADALLSTGKVRERLDPAVTAKKGIERHHLFPRAYLRNVLGIKDTRQINQIANMALVEWNDNIAISDKRPGEYWPEQLASKTHLSEERLRSQTLHHALPDGWVDLPFNEFLVQRRRLMAAVVREAFQRMSQSEYEPHYPHVQSAAEALAAAEDITEESVSRVTVLDLVNGGLLAAGTVLIPRREGIDDVAEVDENGQIIVRDVAYDTPSGAAAAVCATAANGWRFWLADTPQGQRSLHAIRARYQSSNGTDAGGLDGEE